MPRRSPSRKTGALALAMMLLFLVPSMSTAQKEECAEDCIREKVYHHLKLMGELEQDEALEASLHELIELGAPVARVVEDLYNELTRKLRADPRQSAELNSMRWRVVNLMGYLGRPESVLTLYDIARWSLPDPRADENLYAREYRIRLRAVVGLEKLKAIDQLKQLYELGGPLRNAVTASLFELGAELPGTRRVDARAALEQDEADQADYNPNPERKAQPSKPGAKRYKVEPKPDTPKTKPPDGPGSR